MLSKSMAYAVEVNTFSNVNFGKNYSLQVLK